MKVAPKVILLFNDSCGYGAAIFSALKPCPNSDLQRREESFHLSLEKYEINDQDASGKILHFQSPTGVYEVSVLLLENYEPPILACAVSETLAALTSCESSTVPTIVAPFLVPATQLKTDRRFSATTDQTQIYGLQFGPASDDTQALCKKLPNPPPSLQVFHEQLACSIHFVRVLMLPTMVLVGKIGESTHNLTSDEQLQAMYGIGECLASFLPLCLSRERITLEALMKTSREKEEPWRGLYG